MFKINMNNVLSTSGQVEMIRLTNVIYLMVVRSVGNVVSLIKVLATMTPEMWLIE